MSRPRWQASRDSLWPDRGRARRRSRLAAQAHGPIAPAASSYFAKVLGLPAGLEAKVVDGDLRMWLQVPPDQTLVVIDYRGAPYLRFSRTGMEVNHNSSMYYLNQTPVAQTPADVPDREHAAELAPGGRRTCATNGTTAGCTRSRRSRCRPHPGSRSWDAGHIPLQIDGRLAAISGGLWHADDPSIVWFWGIVVLVACVLAAWRVRRPLT